MSAAEQLMLKLGRLFDKPARQISAKTAPGPRRGRPLRGHDEALTAEASALVRALRGHRELAEKVRVVWNRRLQTTAGAANPRRWEIELNPRIVEFGSSVTKRILRHELAHLVSSFRAGRRRISAHGPEWREACRDLGIPNESRCHSLPLPGRKVTYRYAYRCSHCGRLLKRVKALGRNSACYDCCRRFNHGRYDAAYRYVRVPLPEDPPTGEK